MIIRVNTRKLVNTAQVVEFEVVANRPNYAIQADYEPRENTGEPKHVTLFESDSVEVCENVLLKLYKAFESGDTFFDMIRVTGADR